MLRIYRAAQSYVPGIKLWLVINKVGALTTIFLQFVLSNISEYFNGITYKNNKMYITLCFLLVMMSLFYKNFANMSSNGT